MLRQGDSSIGRTDTRLKGGESSKPLNLLDKNKNEERSPTDYELPQGATERKYPSGIRASIQETYNAMAADTEHQKEVLRRRRDGYQPKGTIKAEEGEFKNASDKDGSKASASESLETS